MKKFLRNFLIIIAAVPTLALANPAEEKIPPQPKTHEARLLFRNWNDPSKLTREEKEVFIAVKPQIAHDIARLIGSVAISGIDLYFSNYNIDDKERDEVFVCYNSTMYCRYGSSCPMYIFQFNNQKWEAIQDFSTTCQARIADSKTNGFHDLIINKAIKSEKDNWEWVPVMFKWNKVTYVEEEAVQNRK